MTFLQIESEVLLLCARAELGQDQREQLRTLVAGCLDWDYFYRLARRHSLVPLVFFQLNKLAAELVPSEALAQCRRDYQENAARNVLLTDELVSALRALSETGVDAITFKGPALAVAAYGDLSLRRFVDLDLIVRRDDVAA